VVGLDVSLLGMLFTRKKVGWILDVFSWVNALWEEC
jgi:hypothetical protein